MTNNLDADKVIEEGEALEEDGAADDYPQPPYGLMDSHSNLLALAKQQRDRIQKLEEPWQPIETAPKDKEIILGRFEDGEMTDIANDRWYQDRESSGEWEEYNEYFPDRPPTHWMHKPKEPS